MTRTFVERLGLTWMTTAIRASFAGDNGSHTVSLDHDQWHCDCHLYESAGACVHTLAVQKMLFRYREEILFREELFGRDEERVPRERGETLIGRIAVTCRPERQYLPVFLLRVGEEINELVSIRTKIADAEFARQTRRMQQYP